MTQDIYPIYHNSYGIAFQWKRDISRNNFNKIQLVFRNTGFYLTVEDIESFANNIKNAKQCGDCKCCGDTISGNNILLRTPSDKIDLAVDKKELGLIEDLIEGTLFQIKLDNYLNGLCNN